MNDAHFRERLAWAQEQLEIGNFGRVERVVQEVLDSGADDLKPAARRLRGIAFFQQGQVGDAIEVMNRVLEDNPDDEQALYVRSRGYILIQDLIKAGLDAEKLRTIAPDSPHYVELLIEIKGLLGHFSDIIPLCDRVLELDADSEHILASRGHAFLQTGQYDNAIADFRKLIDGGWENEYLYNNLGLAHSRKGDYEQALTLLDKALEFNPRHAHARSNRGFALFKLGDAADGLRELHLALQLDPDNANAYKNRALIYLALDERDEAHDDLLTAKELDYSLFLGEEVDRLLREEFGEEE